MPQFDTPALTRRARRRSELRVYRDASDVLLDRVGRDPQDSAAVPDSAVAQASPGAELVDQPRLDPQCLGRLSHRECLYLMLAALRGPVLDRSEREH